MWVVTVLIETGKGVPVTTTSATVFYWASAAARIVTDRLAAANKTAFDMYGDALGSLKARLTHQAAERYEITLNFYETQTRRAPMAHCAAAA